MNKEIGGEDMDTKNQGKKGGQRQLNEQQAPQYQETEADEQVGIGNDTLPMNGEPVPPEGISEDDI